MTAPWEDRCADCRKEIPPRGNKGRRIPRRKGKYGIVCDDCATAIDAQATLADPETGKPLGKREKERLVA